MPHAFLPQVTLSDVLNSSLKLFNLSTLPFQGNMHCRHGRRRFLCLDTHTPHSRPFVSLSPEVHHYIPHSLHLGPWNISFGMESPRTSNTVTQSCCRGHDGSWSHNVSIHRCDCVKFVCMMVLVFLCSFLTTAHAHDLLQYRVDTGTNKEMAVFPTSSPSSYRQVLIPARRHFTAAIITTSSVLYHVSRLLYLDWS
jgi:hypothetical protein